MSFENRHVFNGAIKGKKLNAFANLDYKIKDLSTRKEKVNTLLDNAIDETGRNFFEVYFDEYYKPESNQSDELSEKNNVCRVLESMANYLLGSEEVREDRKNDEQKYRFYINREEFDLRTKKEDFLDGMVPVPTEGSSNINNHDNVMHFLLENQRNTKKLKIQVITPADLKEDSLCGQILRDYNSMYKVVTNSLADPSEYKGKRYKLTKIKKDLYYDMLYCKDHLKGVFGYKLRNPLPDSTVSDWDSFDWKNSTHVKELIYLQVDFNPEKETAFMIMDLESLVNKMIDDKSLTDKELATYKMIRLGYKNIEISKALNVNKSRISILVNTIVEKICKSAEKYKY